MLAAFKYYSPLIVYVLAVIAFTNTGIWCWLTLLYAWVMIPLAELFLKPDAANMQQTEEQLAKANKLYDYILYFIVMAQYAAIVLFLFSMKDSFLSRADIFGRVWTMGLLCGTFGINVGHELGHRSNRFEKVLAKASLLTSLYMHFYIEHNKGHHKRVGLREDPNTARLWEPVYFFYFRSVVISYIHAWQIAAADMKKSGKPVISVYNEMIQFHLIQLLFVAIIFISFGWLITVYYILAAGIGAVLLETVNYIEHYGLSRKMIAEGKYERAMPAHSWNSDHVIGRLMLFELSRHSDHHYLASRKYQVLRHHDDSPQMPTGYPGMMILSLFPPAWFYIMHRRMKAYNIPTKKGALHKQNALGVRVETT